MGKDLYVHKKIESKIMGNTYREKTGVTTLISNRVENYQRNTR